MGKIQWTKAKTTKIDAAPSKIYVLDKFMKYFCTKIISHRSYISYRLANSSILYIPISFIPKLMTSEIYSWHEFHWFIENVWKKFDNSIPKISNIIRNTKINDVLWRQTTATFSSWNVLDNFAFWQQQVCTNTWKSFSSIPFSDE